MKSWAIATAGAYLIQAILGNSQVVAQNVAVMGNTATGTTINTDPKIVPSEPATMTVQTLYWFIHSRCGSGS